MARSSNRRYRSYKDRKKQNKKLRFYILRVLILVVLYGLFTSLIAVTVQVNNNSMAPNLSQGDNTIIIPQNNLNTILRGDNSSSFQRGELLLTQTNYVIEPTFIQRVLDPIVRIFTLQKKSLLYDNQDYKGRSQILRVVGLPGDTIKIENSTVYIKPDGDQYFLSEFELSDIDYDITKMNYAETWKEDFPFSSKHPEEYISEGHLFLISDDRSVFNDSRTFGQVSFNQIVGKLFFRYWPLNEIKIFK